ncbi:MAG: hypothetical protein ABIP48_19155, partial [Planctomycetota bacterium]
DGRSWSAVVKLGPQTDKFQVTGYPVLFRAVITGGAIKETLSTMTVDIEQAARARRGSLTPPQPSTAGLQ